MDNSKNSKNDSYRWRSLSKPVVHKTNSTSSTFLKKSLRANNRALARALSKKKLEVSNLHDSYVKLQAENHFLRIHVQGCDTDMNMFLKDKFSHFKDTIGQAVKLLHGMCGELIEVSTRFDNMSHFYEDLQAASVNRGATSSQSIITRSSRPAQRVATQPYGTSDDVFKDDLDRSARSDDRWLGPIDEEMNSIITDAGCDDSLNVEGDEAIEEFHDEQPNLSLVAVGNDNNEDKVCGDLDITDVEDVVDTRDPRTSRRKKSTVDSKRQSNAKEQIKSGKRKTLTNKPGHVRYSAVKHSSEGGDKKYRSSTSSLNSSFARSSTESIQFPSSDIEPPMHDIKDADMSVYDIAFDDSNRVPPLTLHVDPVKKVAEKRVPEVLDKEPSEENDRPEAFGEEQHGIMLRLGTGKRTKPKNKSKAVSHREKRVCTEESVALFDKVPIVCLRRGKFSQEVLVDDVSVPVEDDGNVAQIERGVLKSTENLERDSDELSKEVMNAKEVEESLISETGQIGEFTLRCSTESRISSDDNTRKRRAASNVNYKEPSLHVKLRKGDPHTSTIYNRQNGGKKKGKRAPAT